jgi:hypothetical protein
MDSAYLIKVGNKLRFESDRPRNEPYNELAKSIFHYSINLYSEIKSDSLEKLNYQFLSKKYNEKINHLLDTKTKNLFLPHMFDNLDTSIATKRLDFMNKLVKTNHFFMIGIDNMTYTLGQCHNNGYYLEKYNDTVSEDSIIVIIRIKKKYLIDELPSTKYVFSTYNKLQKTNSFHHLNDSDPIIFCKKIHRKVLKNSEPNYLYQLSKIWGNKTDTIFVSSLLNNLK